MLVIDWEERDKSRKLKRLISLRYNTETFIFRHVITGKWNIIVSPTLQILKINLHSEKTSIYCFLNPNDQK